MIQQELAPTEIPTKARVAARTSNWTINTSTVYETICVCDMRKTRYYDNQKISHLCVY